MFAIVTDITGVHNIDEPEKSFEHTLTFVGIGENGEEAEKDALAQAEERMPHARLSYIHRRRFFDYQEVT